MSNKGIESPPLLRTINGNFALTYFSLIANEGHHTWSCDHKCWHGKDHELLPSLNLVAQCNSNKKLFHTGTFYGPPVP